MKLLLDTHALLWWFVDDRRLSTTVRALIAQEDNEILVSSACAWEVAIKHRLGKLREAEEVVLRFVELIEEDGFTVLPIQPNHALMAGSFAIRHRDPFDRVLAAQAIIEGAPLATRDSAFASFPVRTIW